MTAGRPMARYEMTYTMDSTPARSCGAANGTIVRIAPWNPAPNPAPAMTAPPKKSAADRESMATSVMPTPTTSAIPPNVITPRGAALRSRSTATTALAASVNNAEPGQHERTRAGDESYDGRAE